jgi:hypothetical protein
MSNVNINTEKSNLEFATAVMVLGSRVAGLGRALVRRGKVKRWELAIVAFDVSEEKRVELGLMNAGDYGFSGHSLYVIA